MKGRKEGIGPCASWLYKPFQRIKHDILSFLNIIFIFSIIPYFCPQIPNGRKYSKMWIINLIQSHCSVTFKPIDVRDTIESQGVHIREIKRGQGHCRMLASSIIAVVFIIVPIHQKQDAALCTKC